MSGPVFQRVCSVCTRAAPTCADVQQQHGVQAEVLLGAPRHVVAVRLLTLHQEGAGHVSQDRQAGTDRPGQTGGQTGQKDRQAGDRQDRRTAAEEETVLTLQRSCAR